MLSPVESIGDTLKSCVGITSQLFKETVFIHCIADPWAKQQTQDDMKSLQLKLLSNPFKASG